MSGFEYLAAGLELWTVVGLVGLTISAVRGERRKLRVGVGWLVGVWVLYLAVLLVVSSREPETHVAVGRPVCFGAVCYTVRRVEEVAGFPARNRDRLVRLTVEVANRGGSAHREEVGAVLRDGQGRVWRESVGVSGNPLDGRVAAGATVVSLPVFQVAEDATGLGLVLRHGRGSRHLLVIGDAESWRHRLRVMDLGR